MSAQVLLNLLNELVQNNKMRGLPSISSIFFFCKVSIKFNNTRMLDSIYDMTLRLL